MFEENFCLPVICGSLVSPKGDWRNRVVRDLDSPKFKTTCLEALLFRLRRNYLWLCAIILIAWLAKLFIRPLQTAHFGDIFDRMGTGPLFSWTILTLVVAFFAGAVLPFFTDLGKRAAVDEICGFERDLERWKF